MVSYVCCHRNEFIGHTLARAVSSGSTIIVFQLPCHVIFSDAAIYGILNDSINPSSAGVGNSVTTDICVQLNNDKLFNEEPVPLN